MLQTTKFNCLVIGLILVVSLTSQAKEIQIANPSFEIPEIDPDTNPFLAIPVVALWNEIDNDLEASSNTGTFYNPPPDGSKGVHIQNADGKQLMFIGSQIGNAITQEPNDVDYDIGHSYILSVDICVATVEPSDTDTLTLALYYLDDDTATDIATTIVASTGLTSSHLVTFTVELPVVQSDDAWAGKNLGLAIRATGEAGGFWDADNVKLIAIPSFPDFNGDNIVNLLDLAVVAAEWQDCNDPATDLTGDQCISIPDLKILAQHWLEHAEPL